MSLGLPMGLALASGMNTYLPLFALALFARFGNVVQVSPRFQWLISDQAIVILAILAACEILADKFPGLDNVWDFIHTLLRPVAGALAAGAVLSTDQVFELLLVMLTGATLATAAHSAKASVRLVSTTKGFGIANPILSLVEDVAAVFGTLLSIYAPWVMLVLALLFVIALALLGPPLARMLRLNLSMLGGWLRWVGRKITRHSDPKELRASLLEVSPDRLRTLNGELEPGEELLGTLRGWKRSGWGPRQAWLLITPGRLILVEPRILRGPKTQATPHPELALVRSRISPWMARLEFVTRQNQSVAIFLPKSQAAFAALAAEQIRAVAVLGTPPLRPGTATVAPVTS